MRFINHWANNVADSAIYITPDIMRSTYEIDLQTIQSVLAELEEHEHIEVLQKPNHRLTAAQRARRDDEEDYYLVAISESFADFYKSVEQAEPFHRADVIKPKPAPADPNAKVKYDSHAQQLIYGEAVLPIKGALKQEVCKRVFKNRKTAVNYNDILDTVDFNKQSRAVYDAVRAINEQAKTTLGLEDVLEPIPSKEKVRISKNYL